jgi:alpha/beta hydrolase fold
VIDDFHPDLRGIARFTPSRGIRMTPRRLPIARQGVALLGIGGPRDIEVVSLGPGAGVRVQRQMGLTGPARGLLWIHGGCYVIGCAAQDDRLCRRFASALGAVVASVEYRVAPEHPYPAALDVRGAARGTRPPAAVTPPLPPSARQTATHTLAHRGHAVWLDAVDRLLGARR